MTSIGANASSRACLSVGALVTGEMMRDGMELTGEMKDETNFTWSSKGPCRDGHMGVSLCAPGGAISPICQFQLSRSKWMNGTSMASPNAAGCVALLLSGLKANGVSWGAERIYRALLNTARKLPNVSPFAQNRGVIQILDAFEFALKYSNATQHDFKFAATTSGGKRGIYLREPCETGRIHTNNIVVDVKWSPNVESRGGSVNVGESESEMNLKIRSTQPWIKCEESICIDSKVSSFAVVVDPTHPSLGSGVHFGEILAFDQSYPESGPVFVFPVTVMLPHNRHLFESGRSKELISQKNS
eukprot:1002112_1